MKKTYGQILVDNQKDLMAIDDDIIEYRKKMEIDIWQNIVDTVAKTKDQSLYKNRDFFIVLLMKVQRIGQVPHTLVLARRSCPTPVYKQSVWKYNHASGALEFMWTIPDKILYFHILNHKQKYLADKECADLAKFVILMESGELLNWVKKENGEKIDAIIKIKEQE